MSESDTDDNDSTVRRMAIERGPSWVNDLKAWVGRRVRDTDTEPMSESDPTCPLCGSRIREWGGHMYCPNCEWDDGGRHRDTDKE